MTQKRVDTENRGFSGPPDGFEGIGIEPGSGQGTVATIASMLDDAAKPSNVGEIFSEIDSQDPFSGLGEGKVEIRDTGPKPSVEESEPVTVSESLKDLSPDAETTDVFSGGAEGCKETPLIEKTAPEESGFPDLSSEQSETVDLKTGLASAQREPGTGDVNQTTEVTTLPSPDLEVKTEYDVKRERYSQLQQISKAKITPDESSELASLETYFEKFKQGEQSDRQEQLNRLVEVAIRRFLSLSAESEIQKSIEELKAVLSKPELKLREDPGPAMMPSSLATVENIVTYAHGLYLKVLYAHTIGVELWSRYVRGINDIYECRSENVAQGKADLMVPELSNAVSAIRSDYAVANFLWTRISEIRQTVSRQVSAYSLTAPVPSGFSGLDGVTPEQRKSSEAQSTREGEQEITDLLSGEKRSV